MTRLRALAGASLVAVLTTGLVAAVAPLMAGAVGAGSFSISDAAVAEGTGGTTNLAFTVSISQPNVTDVAVDFTASDGTAKVAGGDYSPTTGTAIIPALATSVIVNVPVGTDSVPEPNEALTVTLSNNETGTTIADGTGTGTIQNDDGPPPSFSIADVTVPEGDAGSANATFTVTLSSASTLETSVAFTTAPGTAVAGTDFGTTSGSKTFAPGETTATIDVPITGDTTDEADETFTVTLSNADDAVIGDGSATGTIDDDDAAPTISVPDAAVGEGNSGTVALTFTATLSAPSGQLVTVDYATAVGGTNPATAGVDYVSTGGTATFVPGDTVETVTVTVNGDTLDEPNEQLLLNLTSPLNASVPDAQAVGTITDDEAAPAISIADASVAEGNAGAADRAITVSLSVPSGQPVSVAYATSDGTATQPGDYAATNGTVTFDPGQTSKTFPVSVHGDVLDEPNETVTLTLSAPTNATIADGAGVLTITDDDATPSLTISDEIVAEGNAGSTAETFTVTLSAASGQAVTVNASTADGSATAGVDYAPRSNVPLTIPAGETSTTIDVSAFGDLVDEADETATVNLSGATNATVTDPSGTLTITDDDIGPTISVSDVTALEGSGAGTTDFGFTVSLSTASAQTITVAYATQDVTAVAPSDYAAAAATLTFTPGQTSKPVVISVSRDAFAEPSETFLLSLSAPTNASIADGTGVGTINNDDGPASTLSIGDATASEASSATFTITLTPAASQPVTVNVATSGGTATPTADYDPAGAVKTIPAGQTSTTFVVPLVDDSVDEPSETFDVTLSNATNAAIADGAATGTITDDDATPSISVADDTVGESDGSGELTVTLSNPSSVDVTVDYATANGTASPADYTSESGTVTIEAGDTTDTIDLAVTPDALDEASETVVVTLTNPANATVADDTGILTITDDDATPTVSIADAGVVEGDAGTTDAAFTVTLSAASGQTVSVTATTATGTASATDFTAKSATVTFTPGDTSEPFTVAVAGDTKAEVDEAYSVGLTAPSNATVADGTGAGSITEDDGGGTFTPVTPARILDTRTGVGRGGSTAKIPNNQTIVLDVTGVGGIPASGVDAVVINTTVTQPAAGGFVSVTPSGGSSTSSLNFATNQTVANLVTVPVGGDGSIRLYNGGGSTHLIGDVVGWYAADSSTTPGSHFVGLTPARILDTRDGTGRGGSTAKVGSGQTIAVDVTGVGGVPATGVAAVVVNTTVTQPTAGGFLSVTPNGGSSTSSLNFTAGETQPNLVVVPVGGDGSIRIFNSAGQSHVIGDIVGWYTTPGTLAASVFEPVAPSRVLDTRTGTGRGGTVGKLASGQTILLDVTGVGGVPTTGVNTVLLNTTVTGPTATGFVSVTPAGGTTTSNLNYVAGETVANLVSTRVGSDGNVRLTNVGASTHLIGDLVGWFTAPAT